MGYALYSRYFAQLNLKLPFFDFPVFIGEILLGMCLLLLAVKWFLFGSQINASRKKLYISGIAGYMLFLMVKTAAGYVSFGPLALRNAALFYYPLFALIAFEFYDEKVFSPKVCGVAGSLFVLSLIVRTVNPYGYFLFTFLMFALFFLYRSRSLILQFLCGILLAVFLPYLRFFATPRANVIASLAGAGICVWLFFTKLNIPKIVRILAVFIFLFVSFVSSRIFLEKKEWEGVTNFCAFLKTYHVVTVLIDEAKETYVMYDIPVKVYEKERKPYSFQVKRPIAKTDVIMMAEKIDEKLVKKNTEVSSTSKKIEGGDEKIDSKLRSVQAALASEPRNNIIWRLLVWRDMLKEMCGENIILGVHFGKPFRSASIEMLGWNRREIESVGWLEPHNSYVHILYRAGVIGMIGIIFLFYLFALMVRQVMISKSTAGIFLISIVVYWFVVANFLVTFELPFFAIPFWSIFGLTAGYCRYFTADRNVNR